jgi:uncharacterized membrane-anchored protein
MASLENATDRASLTARQMLNKVPEITLWFWFIKVMCTTVGETAADFLNVNLNFGLTGTSIVTGVLLAIALFFQFRAKRYTPIKYWLTVMFISVFGTLVTDNLTDRLGVPLETSTIVFSILLAATFLIWYYYEKTLSVHSIFTKRREVFYWLTILFTFALGTAAGDLMAEGLGLGYAVTGFIIAGLIAIFAIGWKLKLNHVLAFWLVYILTRPLGASLGDYLSQPPKYGGLGLGATITSFIFVGGILAIVTYLSITKRDVIEKESKEEIKEEVKGDTSRSGLWQTAVVVASLVIVGLIGYHIRQAQLQAPAVQEIQQGFQASTTTASGNVVHHVFPSTDLSDFRTITQDTLDLVNTGKLSDATTRIADLEHDWDAAEARLKPMNPTKWTEMDGAIDKVLRQLRAVNPNAFGCKSALEVLLQTIDAN